MMASDRPKHVVSLCIDSNNNVYYKLLVVLLTVITLPNITLHHPAWKIRSRQNEHADNDDLDGRKVTTRSSRMLKISDDRTITEYLNIPE